MSLGKEPQRDTALITLQLKRFFYYRVTVTPLKIYGAKVSCKQAERENSTISANRQKFNIDTPQ